MERKNTILKALMLLSFLVFGIISSKAQIVYVDQDATGTGDGASWANAFTDLQSAVDAAEAVAIPSAPIQVWVKADTYYPTSGTDRTISFIMKNDVEIYGGFAGNETNLIDRDWVNNETILSGDIGAIGVNTDNSQVVVHNSNYPTTPLELSAILDGFTIEDGYMDDASLTGGAGMRNNNSSPTVRNCVFRNNTNVQITNGLTRGGAMLAVSASNPLIQSCKFYNNSARSGGAIAFRSPTYHNVESRVINCLFYDNTSYYLGGAIMVENHWVSFYNNTFTRNVNTGSQGYGWGGAIYYQLSPNTNSSQIANNIIWGNTGLLVNSIYTGGSSNFPVYTTNIIDFNTSTPDPEFLDPDNDDFSLNPCLSPAVDAGTSSSIPSGLFTDLGLGSREFNGTVDIGAYEVQGFPVSFSAIESADVSCNGADDGQISVNAGSDFPPIEFSLDNANYVSSMNFTGLAPGTYTVYARDATGCTDNSVVVIDEPAAISISSVSHTNITCNGDEDGTLTVEVSGGSTPYQVSFDGGTTYASAQFTTQTIINNLDPGSYDVTVVDGGGCTITYPSSIVLTEPDVLSAALNVTDVLCNDETTGEISVSASGGTTPYSYSIDGSNFQSSSVFSALSAGSYTVIVRDENQCTRSFPASISEPDALEMSLTTIDPLCAGGQNGQINMLIDGGTSPYQFSVNSGTLTTGSSIQLNADAGDYEFYAVDANGCEVTQTVTLVNEVTVAASVSHTDPLCMGESNGEIVASGSGGSGPYEYSIDDGNTFQSSPTFSGLQASVYFIDVRDANGCLARTSVTLQDPDLLELQPNKTDISCKGQSDGIINAVSSGGTSPYEYSLDGTNFQSSAEFSNLGADTYTVTVRDDNGCLQTVDVIISEPSEIEVIVVQNGRNFSVSASGGTEPFEYSMGGTTFQTSGSFNNLDPGTYTFLARDMNGCVAESTTFEVVLGVYDPSVSVYPNPSSEYLAIEGRNFDKIVIYDMQGKAVLMSDKKKTISIARLSKGMHILRLYEEGKMVHHQKIIVN